MRLDKSFDCYVIYHQNDQPCPPPFGKKYLLFSLWKGSRKYLLNSLQHLLGNSDLFESYDDKIEYEVPCDLHNQSHSHIMKPMVSPDSQNALSLSLIHVHSKSRNSHFHHPKYQECQHCFNFLISQLLIISPIFWIE